MITYNRDPLERIADALDVIADSKGSGGFVYPGWIGLNNPSGPEVSFINVISSDFESALDFDNSLLDIHTTYAEEGGTYCIPFTKIHPLGPSVDMYGAVFYGMFDGYNIEINNPHWFYNKVDSFILLATDIKPTDSTEDNPLVTVTITIDSSIS